jgi:hypothetical protein
MHPTRRKSKAEILPQTRIRIALCFLSAGAEYWGLEQESSGILLPITPNR